MNTDNKTLSKERLALIALILYVFPYAYLLMSLHIRDATGFIWGCLLIMGITGVLALAVRIYGSVYWVLIGNAFSIFMSYWLLGRSAFGTQWLVFWEPFHPQQALLWYIGALLIPQTFVVVIAEIMQRRKSRAGSQSNV